MLNGFAFDISSPFTLSQSDVLTGTLEDGSSFVFSRLNFDSLNGVNLIETSTPAVNITTQTIDTASTLGGIARAQTLTVETGGELGDDFTAVNATLNVEAGSVGSEAIVVASEVNISGGTVGSQLLALNSTINVSGGVVGRFSDASSGSTVNVSGGNVGDNFDANSSTVNVLSLIHI